MRYRILKDGETLNTIVSNEEFVTAYCAENGYTFEAMPEPEHEPKQPTDSERLALLESENTMLKAQVSAQSDQMDFYEDCIAEMAAVVYA